jgi:hypothetical protein
MSFFLICGLSACPEKVYYYNKDDNQRHTLIMRTPQTGKGLYLVVVYTMKENGQPLGDAHDIMMIYLISKGTGMIKQCTK